MFAAPLSYNLRVKPLRWADHCRSPESIRITPVVHAVLLPERFRAGLRLRRQASKPALSRMHAGAKAGPKTDYTGIDPRLSFAETSLPRA